MMEYLVGTAPGAMPYADAYNLAQNGDTIRFLSGQVHDIQIPYINKSITLTGESADAAGNTHVRGRFHVFEGAAVTIKNLSFNYTDPQEPLLVAQGGSTLYVQKAFILCGAKQPNEKPLITAYESSSLKLNGVSLIWSENFQHGLIYGSKSAIDIQDSSFVNQHHTEHFFMFAECQVTISNTGLEGRLHVQEGSVVNLKDSDIVATKANAISATASKIVMHSTKADCQADGIETVLLDQGSTLEASNSVIVSATHVSLRMNNSSAKMSGTEITTGATSAVNIYANNKSSLELDACHVHAAHVNSLNVQDSACQIKNSTRVESSDVPAIVANENSQIKISDSAVIGKHGNAISVEQSALEIENTKFSSESQDICTLYAATSTCDIRRATVRGSLVFNGCGQVMVQGLDAKQSDAQHRCDIFVDNSKIAFANLELVGRLYVDNGSDITVTDSKLVNNIDVALGVFAGSKAGITKTQVHTDNEAYPTVWLENNSHLTVADSTVSSVQNSALMVSGAKAQLLSGTVVSNESTEHPAIKAFNGSLECVETKIEGMLECETNSDVNLDKTSVLNEYGAVFIDNSKLHATQSTVSSVQAYTSNIEINEQLTVHAGILLQDSTANIVGTLHFTGAEGLYLSGSTLSVDTVDFAYANEQNLCAEDRSTVSIKQLDCQHGEIADLRLFGSQDSTVNVGG